MSQSVCRYTKSIRNKNNYELDLEIRELVRMLLSTALLQPSDVLTAFETLQKTISETTHPFLNYFEYNYNGHTSASNGTHQNPTLDFNQFWVFQFQTLIKIQKKCCTRYLNLRPFELETNNYTDRPNAHLSFNIFLNVLSGFGFFMSNEYA